MMPTTREASTPSRSAIRRAESTKTPVVSYLQLHFKSTPTRDIRQPDQLGPISFPRLGYPTLTLMRALRPATALFLSVLLCAQVPAQAPSASQPQSPVVRPDLKRAQKYVDQGDKAAAHGKVDEALQAYDEATRYAPQEGYVLERGAALRSKLVRAYAEAAERDA